MSDEYPEIDPLLFTSDREFDFVNMMVEAAHGYAASKDLIDKYEHDNSEEAKAGRRRELGDERVDIEEEVAESIDSIASIIGKDVLREALGEEEGIGRIIQETVTQSDYEEALSKRVESALVLVALVEGYQKHLSAGMSEFYGDADEDRSEVEITSWTTAWTKLRDTIKPQSTTLLADIASVFDYFVQTQFGSQYRPDEHDRGSAVRSQTKTRTFYEVMGDHLGRAIMRSGEDGWTGY